MTKFQSQPEYQIHQEVFLKNQPLFNEVIDYSLVNKTVYYKDYANHKIVECEIAAILPHIYKYGQSIKYILWKESPYFYKSDAPKSLIIFDGAELETQTKLMQKEKIKHEKNILKIVKKKLTKAEIEYELGYKIMIIK